jgi:hypothetical protein
VNRIKFEVEPLVIVEFWQQDTRESGRWVRLPPMLRSIAEKVIGEGGCYECGKIIEPEEGASCGSLR